MEKEPYIHGILQLSLSACAVSEIAEQQRYNGKRRSHPAYDPRARGIEGKLRRWEPWGHRIDFDNGVSTKNFKRRIPFSEHPLNKFGLVETTIPFRDISDTRLLDIGCCAGYNSIHAAMNYGARSTYEIAQTPIDAMLFRAPSEIKVA
ncbi:MAG TPA: hypothetical protein VNV64_02325 [Candidatus Binatia bacterium]|nr:hypothetical protein [Candidatus Binatia bacterium]